jgi:cobalamin synthase
MKRAGFTIPHQREDIETMKDSTSGTSAVRVISMSVHAQILMIRFESQNGIIIVENLNRSGKDGTKV